MYHISLVHYVVKALYLIEDNTFFLLFRSSLYSGVYSNVKRRRFIHHAFYMPTSVCCYCNTEVERTVHHLIVDTKFCGRKANNTCVWFWQNPLPLSDQTLDLSIWQSVREYFGNRINDDTTRMSNRGSASSSWPLICE